MVADSGHQVKIWAGVSKLECSCVQLDGCRPPARLRGKSGLILDCSDINGRFGLFLGFLLCL